MICVRDIYRTSQAQLLFLKLQRSHYSIPHGFRHRIERRQYDGAAIFRRNGSRRPEMDLVETVQELCE